MVHVIESLRRHFGHASFRAGQEELAFTPNFGQHLQRAGFQAIAVCGKVRFLNASGIMRNSWAASVDSLDFRVH